MNALSGGNGGIWGMRPFHHSHRGGKGGNGKRGSSAKPSEATGGAGYSFPIKQAATAASLALAGDTLAQLRERWVSSKSINYQHKHPTSPDSHNNLPQDVSNTLVPDHNWLRALRMTSYGFLLYGPGSYVWYQFLDRCMPKQTVQNVFTKVLLNQIVLGPCVIAVVFAWNNLWQGKLAELPKKYQKDALPTLIFGFRFWIPVSILNFWVVPLQARVAFMSMGSVFWNFCLSSTMNKLSQDQSRDRVSEEKQHTRLPVSSDMHSLKRVRLIKNTTRNDQQHPGGFRSIAVYYVTGET